MIIILIALVIRILFVGDFYTPWYGDQESQLHYAWAVARGIYFTQFDSYWPPGSIVFSGIILKIFGATRPVFYVQAVIGALTVIFIEQIGRRFFGSIAGLTAAFLYAIYVPFIYYNGVFLSETLFFFFLRLQRLQC
jgi:asparagine N-glycosylation enzyme membrane subunit Stt3